MRVNGVVRDRQAYIRIRVFGSEHIIPLRDFVKFVKRYRDILEPSSQRQSVGH